MVSQVADEKPQLLSKKAGCNSHGQDSSYFLGWQEYEKNPFDPAASPGGIIQMGLAENQLSFSTRTIWMMPPGLAAGSKGFFSYSCHPRK